MFKSIHNNVENYCAGDKSVNNNVESDLNHNVTPTLLCKGIIV